MATRSLAVQASSQQELEAMVAGYIAQGYNVASRTPASVTLVKRKEFSVLWAVIGFIVCVLPLLIYLIVYAAESDQMVIINLVQQGMPVQPAALNAPQPATTGNLAAPRSPDGRYWWDGSAWQPVNQQAPGVSQNPTQVSGSLAAPRSADGRYWWDGSAWQPVAEAQGQSAATSEGQFGGQAAQSAAADDAPNTES